MSKRYVSCEVTCPFYRSEGGQKIYCEGLCEGTSLHLAFASVTKMQEHKERYCCRDYDDCAIADMLYRKYEDDETG